MKKSIIIIAAALMSATAIAQTVVPSGFPELDEWTKEYVASSRQALGYPTNFDGKLAEFYKWYTDNHMENLMTNNAGDPFTNKRKLSSAKFECETLRYFAPFYGYDTDNFWGIVTMSGTDGNNHGIYFGVNLLRSKTGKLPVVYVSDEAHYSNFRLCDLQHLDVKLIKSDAMGQMIPDSLDSAIDDSRPCLVIYAMGSTFKGAIDDMKALNAVLARHKGLEFYRHVDAALFGGYLPFTKYRNLVNCKVMDFESISVSGHKFFGIDSPCGLFITTKEIYDNQSSFDIPYLNADMKMINCSRSGLDVLKFWWLMKTIGTEGWTEQASAMIEHTAYLKEQLQKIGWPCWSNDYSNTVFFKRPSERIVLKYSLACSKDDRFGGDLSHIVVMQHVDKTVIDQFIADLKEQ